MFFIAIRLHYKKFQQLKGFVISRENLRIKMIVLAVLISFITILIVRLILSNTISLNSIFSMKYY
ncbi:hypothetical protein, partial [Coxiella-like endosymbiont]|uniref:hypothetical protein n=1 Tax=Coxiella-like endosymbiont TaxID=1592897 RepID=UPI0019D47E5A